MHEYLRRILLATKKGTLAHPATTGRVQVIKVAHDDDIPRCSIYDDGECDCDPEITVTESDGRSFRVLRDGTAERIRSVT